MNPVRNRKNDGAFWKEAKRSEQYSNNHYWCKYPTLRTLGLRNRHKVEHPTTSSLIKRLHCAWIVTWWRFFAATNNFRLAVLVRLPMIKIVYHCATFCMFTLRIFTIWCRCFGAVNVLLDTLNKTA